MGEHGEQARARCGGERVVQEERGQVGGGGLARRTLLGEMRGKVGADGAPRMALYHLPIMPSGTEFRAREFAFLDLWILPLLPLVTFPESGTCPGDTTPWSPLWCRLFICPTPGSSGRERGGEVSVFLVLTAPSSPPFLHPMGSEVKYSPASLITGVLHSP